MTMAGEPSDGRRMALTVGFAAWVLAFFYSFFAGMEAGAGFRIYAGWQAIAGVVAVAVFGLGRAWPQASAVRRMSAFPLGVAALQALVLAGLAWL